MTNEEKGDTTQDYARLELVVVVVVVVVVVGQRTYVCLLILIVE